MPHLPSSQSHTPRPLQNPETSLHPIPSMEEVSMDFVTRLATTEGYEAILVLVDRFSKMRHLIACNKTANAKDVARRYLDNIWNSKDYPRPSSWTKACSAPPTYGQNCTTISRFNKDCQWHSNQRLTDKQRASMPSWSNTYGAMFHTKITTRQGSYYWLSSRPTTTPRKPRPSPPS